MHLTVSFIVAFFVTSACAVFGVTAWLAFPLAIIVGMAAGIAVAVREVRAFERDAKAVDHMVAAAWNERHPNTRP